ncbi:MAG TPA: peptidoglycan DD-metalloendopeptidase family protein [Myxococcaceae bacterium]|nr:peptidoglycan DD-metalloendopeptidase family protein [Myxococcaceae bacterium]
MSAWRTATALLIAPALIATAFAEAPEQERAAVRQRLAVERAALVALREQKLGVLEVLEFIEQLWRSSAARARRLDSELAALQSRIDLAQEQHALARELVEERLTRLGPRLLVMYRLMRHHPLRSLLSAADFSAMVWRWRAMSELVEGDLRLLGEAKRIADLERLLLFQLSGMNEQLAQWRESARAEHRQTEIRRAELTEIVGSLQADSLESKRAIRELEQADQSLSKLIRQMQISQVSGFAALKGKLPLPTEGTVEVGFGKVVNPKFNTVTVQKGWDIRAPLGSAVKAIASGQVAYAGWLRGYGNVLIIDHGGGFHTLVAHLDSISRGVGEAVRAGDLVGTVGETGSLKGAYLYFEIRLDAEAVDPAAWIGASGSARASARPGKP